MATWKNILTVSDDKETHFLSRSGARIYYDGPGTAGNYRWPLAGYNYAGGEYTQYTQCLYNDRYEITKLYGIHYPFFIAPYDLKISEGCKIYIRFRLNNDSKYSGGKILNMFYRPSDADWDTHWRHTGELDWSPGGSVNYIDSPPIDVDLGGPVNGIMSYQLPTGTGTELSDASYSMEYTLTAGQEINIKRGYPMYVSCRCDGSSSSTSYDYLYNWVIEVECYRI